MDACTLAIVLAQDDVIMRLRMKLPEPPKAVTIDPVVRLPDE